MENTSATTREFALQYLEQITDNFSKERIIGRGGYGVVYKAVLENGEEIALKKLYHMPGLDDIQFMNEFDNLMRVRHPNVTRLVGYCNNLGHKLITYNGMHRFARVEERVLCFEYLQGGSLAKHISDESCGLDWHTRYTIIKGICEGLNYLHNGSENPIYHLDLKPANILLDNNMIPKIGDFGSSRLFSSIATDTEMYFETMGGYMPPEYNDKRIISSKFDVFSLGVIIIQIMAGRDGYRSFQDMPSDDFIKLVRENWRNRLQKTELLHASHEVRTCIEIALRCVEFDRMKRPTIIQIVDELNEIVAASMDMTRKFTLNLLDRVTNHFSTEYILGRGGFGVVYKGILDSGEEIAVKKLHHMPWLDNHQFDNELNNLRRVQHRNIVRLVGYCRHTEPVIVEYKGKLVSASVEERALCFEYLEGGNLDMHLSDESCGLGWHTRYKIIRGICEGLHYLHNGSKRPIYHLDLKPANILLDKDMVPKIGDFGLSRLFDSMQTYITQTQSTMGTRGYMPPEYIDEHQISPKFDIFSLGAIMIRIMAGNVGYSNYTTMPTRQFVELVQENWKKRLTEALSPNASEEVKTCIKIALRCVETDRTKRPNITEIVDELSKIGTPRSSPIAQALECCGLNWIFGCER